MQELVGADCTAAIVAYTHDLQKVEKAGNVYYELNVALRQREASQREDLSQVWGDFMCVSLASSCFPVCPRTGF